MDKEVTIVNTNTGSLPSVDRFACCEECPKDGNKFVLRYIRTEHGVCGYVDGSSDFFYIDEPKYVCTSCGAITTTTGSLDFTRREVMDRFEVRKKINKFLDDLVKKVVYSHRKRNKPKHVRSNRRRLR